MGDRLAATILAGTGQMAEAAEGLARVRTLNRVRKDAAVRAALESLPDAAKAYREYGSWQDAKAAETDAKAALEAARLGRVKGGDAGELTALDGYRPSTLAGYEVATKRRDEATKRAQQAGEQKYRDVQMAHVTALDAAAAAKTKKDDEADAARKTGMLAASKLWPDEEAPTDFAWDAGQQPSSKAGVRALGPAAQMRQREVLSIKALMAADAIDPKDATSRLVQLSQQARQEENDLRTEAVKKEAEAGRNARAASSRKIQQQNADTATARGEAYASHLDAQEENAAAGVRLRGEANQIADLARQDRFAIAQNANNVALSRALADQARADYEGELKALLADKKLAATQMWRPGEDKAAILSGIATKEAALKTAHARLMDVLKALPKPQAMRGSATGGAPAPAKAAGEMDDDELDAAIKAEEAGAK